MPEIWDYGVKGRRFEKMAAVQYYGTGRRKTP
jgi:hypothetical protein